MNCAKPCLTFISLYDTILYVITVLRYCYTVKCNIVITSVLYVRGANLHTVRFLFGRLNNGSNKNK